MIWFQVVRLDRALVSQHASSVVSDVTCFFLFLLHQVSEWPQVHLGFAWQT